MKREEFLHWRKAYLKELEDVKKSVNGRYDALAKEYVSATVPYKTQQVVEVGIGKRMRRMVIFKIDVKVFDENIIMIHLYGWYLDANNNAYKWEGNGITVAGVSNPTPIAISENQTYYPIQ